MQNFKYSILYIAASLACLFNCQAQEKQIKTMPKNQITLMLNGGICFNKPNVHNDGVNPEPIQASELRSGKLTPMLAYQHNTPYGLIYGGGIRYGIYGRKAVAVMASYDTANNMEPLNAKQYRFPSEELYEYLDFNVFVGYYYCLTPKKTKPWYAETKIGISKRYYFAEGGYFRGDLNDFVRTLYLDSTFKGYQPTYIDEIGPKERTLPNYFDGYIGVKKQIACSWANFFFSAGIYSTFQFELPGNSIADGAEITVKSGVYKQGVFQYWDYDYYYNRELTFGIRAGFGLSF